MLNLTQGAGVRAQCASTLLAACFPEASASAEPKRKKAKGPRRLSELQRKGILGLAALRVIEEARERAGEWLRRLDTLHASGCRTRQTRWDALAKLIEPLLARLDLATLCLGWVDANGQFRLNRQQGLVEDTGLSPCTVSRTLAALEQAGYLHRIPKRLHLPGTGWVTRMAIRFRVRFFADLGLSHYLNKVRSRKKADRRQQLVKAEQRKQQQALSELLHHRQRRLRHRAAEAAHQRQLSQQTAQLDAEAHRAYQIQRIDRALQLANESPHLSARERRLIIDREFPL